MAKFESEMKPLLHHTEEIQMPFENDQEFQQKQPQQQKGYSIFVKADVTITYQN